MRIFVLGIIMLTFVSNTKAMYFWSKIKSYMQNTQSSITEKPIKFPERIAALAEMAENGSKDACEFIPDHPYLLSTKIWTHCSKLNKSEISDPSIKDMQLLNFAQTMAKEETEWKSWHVRIFKNEETGNTETKFMEDQFQTSNGKQINLLRDQDSPYFQYCSTTDQSILNTNLVENALYHEELKFLITQLNKMELYWNIEIGQKQAELEDRLDGIWKQEQDKWNTISFREKVCNYSQYGQYISEIYTKKHEEASKELESMHKQKDEHLSPLRETLEIFKTNSKKHRDAFARSGLKKSDFEKLKKAREEYAKE